MFYLIYISSAAVPFSQKELGALLSDAQTNNESLEITGMLLYQDGIFMQMLEGKETRVVELYEKILGDERHSDIRTILTGYTQQRHFKDWSMGFANMEKLLGQPEFSEYIREKLTLHRFPEASQDAYDFITSFYKASER